MWVRLRFWLAVLVRRTRFEQEVADELAFHLRARTDEWVRRGLSPGAALRRARIELGNVDRIKDDLREVRFGGWLARLVQDLRYGCRTLRKRPGITAVGVASLAVGIGTSTFFFSQFNAFFLRPLPGARDPGALVAIGEPLSYPAFARVRELEDTVEAAAAYIGPVPFTVAVDGSAGGGERAFGHHVSPGYFATLGVAPAVGRLLDPEMDRVGSEPVVVVSHQFWTRRLGCRPSRRGSGVTSQRPECHTRWRRGGGIPGRVPGDSGGRLCAGHGRCVVRAGARGQRSGQPRGQLVSGRGAFGGRGPLPAAEAGVRFGDPGDGGPAARR